MVQDTRPLAYSIPRCTWLLALFLSGFQGSEASLFVLHCPSWRAQLNSAILTTVSISLNPKPLNPKPRKPPQKSKKLKP